MARLARFALLFPLLAVPVQFSSPASAQDTVARPDTVERFPGVIMECDGDQCTRGGGGAIWIFEGQHGQAKWHYGAVADLTIERFDGRTVVIRRVDPAGSYSSRFVPPGQLFTAVYTGTIDGDRIDGTVSWGGTWYAKIPRRPCNPFAECPLDANQVLELGQNAAQAKEYSAALFSFLISAEQGNASAQSLAGVMLSKGVGAARDYDAAFRLLQQSAEQDDYNGELGLAQMYETGLGPSQQKDPERAAFWRNRAKKRAEELRAQQVRQAQTQALGALVFFGAVATIVAESSGHDYQREPRRDGNILDQLVGAIDNYEKAQKIGRFIQQQTGAQPSPQAPPK